jgi:hypothetical protein
MGRRPGRATCVHGVRAGGSPGATTMLRAAHERPDASRSSTPAGMRSTCTAASRTRHARPRAFASSDPTSSTR